MKRFAIVLLSIMMIISSIAGTVIVPIGGVQPAGAEYPIPTPQWVYKSTYSGQPVSYWKYTVIGQETLPVNPNPGGSDGGPCDKIEVRIYSDAACTVTMEPTRVATVSIKIKSPMYDWRHVADRQLRQQYSEAVVSGSTVTNSLYYRLYTPSTSFGVPYALDASWTFTKQLDSSNNLGDKTTSGITAVVASATESVTVPAGTFTCYKLTITESSKTIIEYWDASGAFPYAPVKVVDSVSFGSTDTRVLYSSSSTPTPTPTPMPTPTLTPTPIPTLTPTPSSLAKIAYSHDAPSGNAEIYVMNADGSNQIRLTYSPQNDYEPHFSPDTTKIVFASHRSGQWDIYVMNADGSNQTQITYTSGTDAQPSWSPTGSKIAFFSDRDGNSEIYVMNADGSDQTRLTNSPAIDCHPEWSPDGSMIVFVSDRDGNSEIYVMNADGSRQTRLTTSSAADRDPCWSPDGTKIAFASERDGNSEIYVMNADGSSQIRLTSDSAYADYQPSWSPDGNKIAFESDTGGATYENIYVIDANGQNRVQLTYGTDWSFCPSWSSATTPTPDYWDIQYKIVGFQTFIRYSLNGGTPVDNLVDKSGVECGHLTIRFSKGVTSDGRRTVIIPASDFYLDTYSTAPASFNTLLTSDATGTLYTQDDVGDIDVLSESSATTIPQQTNIIGDGTKDTAGSLLINMPLKTYCDVPYLDIHAEASYNFAFTTKHSRNHVTLPGKKMNGYVMEGNGMPCTQSGGPATYVATPLTIVATGTGDGLNMNVYGYNVDSQVKMVFQLVPVSTTPNKPVVACSWVTPDDGDKNCELNLTQTLNDTVQIYAVVDHESTDPVSTVSADLSGFGLGQVSLAAYMPGDINRQTAAFVDASKSGLVQYDEYNEQQILDGLQNGRSQLYVYTASIGNAAPGLYDFAVQAKDTIGQWSAQLWNKLAFWKNSNGAQLVISSFKITPEKTTYSIGETLTAKFVITNTGTAGVTLDYVLVGGRYKGSTDEKLGSGFPDFTNCPMTLGAGESRSYEGTITLTTPGKYHFFCAYHSPTVIENENQDQNKWNCNINVVGADGQIVSGWEEAKKYREKDITVAFWVDVSNPAGTYICSDIKSVSDYVVRDYEGSPIMYEFNNVQYPYAIPADFNFNNDLQSGATGVDVRCLQVLLNANPATQIRLWNGGSPGIESYSFGSLTKTAVEKFQELNGLPVDGEVKGDTIAQCNRLLEILKHKPVKHVPNGWVLKVLTDSDGQPIEDTPDGIRWFYQVEDVTDGTKGWVERGDLEQSGNADRAKIVIFERDSEINQSFRFQPGQLVSDTSDSNEVRYFQIILKHEGVLRADTTIDGKYDATTKQAVKEFQEKYAGEILIPQGLSAGTGVVDTLTLEKLNQIVQEQCVLSKSRTSVILDAVSQYSPRLPDEEAMPRELIMAMVVGEAYPSDYHFDNEWINPNLKHDDPGRGIMQITSSEYVGYGACVRYYATGCNGCGWNGEKGCKQYYTNTIQGIEANFKDAMKLLSDKVTPSMEQHYDDCVDGIPPYSDCTTRYGIEPKEMFQISLIQRYHQYVPHAQDDPNHYLSNLASNLRTLAATFPDGTFDSKIAENLAVKVQNIWDNSDDIVILSPATLRVYDSAGRVTGMIGTDISMEIPFSFCSDDGKTVFIPFSNGLLSYEVTGTSEGTYGLEDISNVNGSTTSFTASTVPISLGAVHRYDIDWEVLSQGEKGVTAQIDSNGDGIFEQTILSDSTLEPLLSEAGEPYESSEGTPVILNASSSYAVGGNISLYEWDINNDGVYELSSTSSTATYTWLDDYTGNVSLRVTDDDGLSSIDTAAVTISNVPPTVEAGADQNAVCCVTNVSFSGSFTDPGTLDIHTIAWNFGDGSNASGTLTPVHKYCSPGVYTVTLTVTDDGGVGIDTLTVHVAIAATVKITPQTLNLKSNGGDNSCTAQIGLPAGYDVGKINVSTVRIDVFGTLIAAQASPSSGGMVKFDRQMVIAAINGSTGTVTITVTGRLNTGAEFIGSDTITVINPGKK